MGRYLTERDRYQIEVLLKEKCPVKRIAELLGKHESTIYKEIKKGTVKQLGRLLEEKYVYKADYAQMQHEKQSANKGRPYKIGKDFAFANYIEQMIGEEKYSPEALLLKMRMDGVQFGTTLCFKTIYNYISAGLFLNITNKDLPYKRDKKARKMRRIRSVALHNIKGRSIDLRPANVLDRADFGHWEMDTVVSGKGMGKACLLVLSERQGRVELLDKLKDKKSISTVSALDRLERKLGYALFCHVFQTITCDNGVEFLDCEGIERSITRPGKKRTIVYYCHPYSSYERGTNENINRMVRRFFPKGTNFDKVKKKDIQRAQAWINHYPRKILGGISSAEYAIRQGIVVK